MMPKGPLQTSHTFMITISIQNIKEKKCLYISKTNINMFIMSITLELKKQTCIQETLHWVRQPGPMFSTSKGAVNSSPCSRILSSVRGFKLYEVLFSWKQPTQDVTLWPQRDGQHSGRLWSLNDAQLVLRGLK